MSLSTAVQPVPFCCKVQKFPALRAMWMTTVTKTQMIQRTSERSRVDYAQRKDCWTSRVLRHILAVLRWVVQVQSAASTCIRTSLITQDPLKSRLPKEWALLPPWRLFCDCNIRGCPRFSVVPCGVQGWTFKNSKDVQAGGNSVRFELAETIPVFLRSTSAMYIRRVGYGHCR